MTQKIDPGDQLMTPPELSDWLGIPLSTLYKWSSHGGGPPVRKVGRHLRYKVTDVQAWLDAQQPPGRQWLNAGGDHPVAS